MKEANIHYGNAKGLKTLWSGSKTSTGTISLNDDITKYDLVYFNVHTNNEDMTFTLVKPQYGIKTVFTIGIASAAGTQSEPFAYRNVIYLTVDSDGTSLGVSETHNNAYLIAGITAIYGLIV